jgi:hypothetical protein
LRGRRDILLGGDRGGGPAKVSASRWIDTGAPGPLFVAASVARTHHFGPAFLWLALPAAGAFIALLFARWARPSKGTPPPAPARKQLPNVFWIYVAAAGLLALGFVDFPLLAFHFQKNSLAQPAVIPLLYAGAMGVNGLTALNLVAC